MFLLTQYVLTSQSLNTKICVSIKGKEEESMRTPIKNFLNKQYTIVIYPTQILPDNASMAEVTEPT